MSPLASAIQSQALTGTAAEIRTAINADVDLPHVHDLWTYNGVAQQFGPEAAEGLAAAMTAAGLTTAVMVYASRGFDLSLDLTRTQLDAIAAGVPALAAVCGALKLIGRPTQKRFTAAGLDALPEESAITEALAEIATQQAFAEFVNECVNPAVSESGATIASVKATVAAWGV